MIEKRTIPTVPKILRAVENSELRQSKTNPAGGNSNVPNRTARREFHRGLIATNGIKRGLR
jgi:hypothetical protein